MSVIAMTIRCDHITCQKMVDYLDAKAVDGWSRHDVPLIGNVKIVMDFCPQHEAERAP